MVIHRRGEPHLAVDGRRVGLVSERAADIVQVLANLGLPQILDARLARHWVVPRHARRLLDERFEPAGGFRVHGLRTDTNPVVPSPTGVGAIWSAMRTFVAGRNPFDQDASTIQSFRREDRSVARLHGLATSTNPTLGCVDIGVAQDIADSVFERPVRCAQHLA